MFELAEVSLRKYQTMGHRVKRVYDSSDEFFTRVRVDFQNGYSMSVIQPQGMLSKYQSYVEIAIMDKNGIVYSTPITDDVIRIGTMTELEDYAQRISRL